MIARIAAITLLLLANNVRSENDDKAILFNTFYLDGEKPSYVLIITEDKKFELFGPDNEQISGTIRASGEHVTLTAGNTKRMFHYDSAGKDIKLGRREGDTLQAGNLLGEMPPQKDGVFRTLYVSEANWIKKGRPVFRRDGKEKLTQPEPPPVAPAPVEPVSQPAAPQPPTPQPAPAQPEPVAASGTFADLAGTYTLKNAGGNDDVLLIQPEGQFTYTRGDGMKQAGTILRADTDLTFMGGGLKRHFTLKTVPSGMELTRRDTDVVKPGEVLGSMPPQDRSALTWMRKGGAQPVAQAPAPEVKPAPATQPVAQAPAPAPAPAPTETKPAPAPAAAAAGVTSVKQMAGSFSHKPSPFISETLVIAEDGSFSYKDSNGASVSGTAKVENGAATFTSGEVIRNFTAKLDGNVLVLTRAEGDNPKFKNDLASMSPTVLKEAKYEKK